MTVDRLDDMAWRVRLCSSRAGLAHLSLPDHRLAVTRGALEDAVARARAIGATHVRTSALSDESAPTLAEAGFVDVDRLVVLRRDIDPTDSRRPTQLGLHRGNPHRDGVTDDPVSADPIHLRQLSRRWLDAAARVDAAAFGKEGTIHRGGLADVLTATPTSWGRRATVKHPKRPAQYPAQFSSGRRPRFGTASYLAGFVLCGMSGGDAYLQRLAVDPEFQRRNIATALVSAALDWMSRSGATNVLVNTRPDNVAALSLYEGLGFQRLTQQLIVAERPL